MKHEMNTPISFLSSGEKDRKSIDCFGSFDFVLLYIERGVVLVHSQPQTTWHGDTLEANCRISAHALTHHFPQTNSPTPHPTKQ